MAVRGKFAQRLFDPALELPILLRFEWRVVERAARDAHLARDDRLARTAFCHHLFFWASESFSVISPTSNFKSVFSRLRRDTSAYVGALSTPLPSQSYTVVS